MYLQAADTNSYLLSLCRGSPHRIQRGLGVMLIDPRPHKKRKMFFAGASHHSRWHEQNIGLKNTRQTPPSVWSCAQAELRARKQLCTCADNSTEQQGNINGTRSPRLPGRPEAAVKIDGDRIRRIRPRCEGRVSMEMKEKSRSVHRAESSRKSLACARTAQ